MDEPCPTPGPCPVVKVEKKWILGSPMLWGLGDKEKLEK